MSTEAGAEAEAETETEAEAETETEAEAEADVWRLWLRTVWVCRIRTRRKVLHLGRKEQPPSAAHSVAVAGRGDVVATGEPHAVRSDSEIFRTVPRSAAAELDGPPYPRSQEVYRLVPAPWCATLGLVRRISKVWLGWTSLSRFEALGINLRGVRLAPFTWWRRGAHTLMQRPHFLEKSLLVACRGGEMQSGLRRSYLRYTSQK